MAIRLRKLVVQVDETRIEMGQNVDPPGRRAVAIAVIENPYAGRYEAKLDALIDAGEELGALLGKRYVEALGIEPGEAQSYGKAAIVGEAGELEHAAAILHPKLGAPLRASRDSVLRAGGYRYRREARAVGVVRDRVAVLRARRVVVCVLQGHDLAGSDQRAVLSTAS
ncbi:MAG: FIG00440100: hypothetical protein [uncultured Paraburkholderia sp.]|nr:MAG: FIG00440100: hypothetical protein [uncultured Paraburkholderia sp.]